MSKCTECGVPKDHGSCELCEALEAIYEEHHGDDDTTIHYDFYRGYR